jgi:TatD DNase family protein
MNVKQHIDDIKQRNPKILVDIHSHNPDGKESIVRLINLRLTDEEMVLKEGAFYSVGIHPWDLQPDCDIKNKLIKLQKFASRAQVISIGETGLDRYIKEPIFEQKLAFTFHLEMSKKFKKPLMLHTVRTHSDMLEILKKEEWAKTKIPIIHHDFKGNKEIVQQYSPYNCFFSFGASLWQNGDHLEVFKNLPIHQIFLETDDQCEFCLEDIYAKASELRNIDQQSLRENILNNFLRVFAPLN